ncbi:response regulator [Mucilaginibacter sp. 10B2]|uniref:response regulator n=1 Tax=Mucilaginibacter sp. 10B2 TaxID=3048574 RepID=UPI002B23463C|nr:response regulator [Mucilaginibacter sp. 10B2]MEB0280860.1 response regulator [Mucilaginibacter sp. 10B2]
MKKIAIVSIIDDDAFFQYATKKMLELSNKVQDILQFHDGEEAIRYFIENKNEPAKIPDLVFLDLHMPYMDGWQFLDKFIVNEFKKELITIYICTSSTSKLDFKKSENYPLLKGYLIKPITKAEFFEKLERELENDSFLD